MREPFNAVSHLCGTLLSLVAMAVLLESAQGLWQIVAFAVYGASLVLLYSISTLYHLLPLSPRLTRCLRRLDHVAIYFLIAGTYTPVALVTLHGRWGWLLLAAVWGVAALGIPFKLFYLDAPRWVSTATYLAMGYLALFAIVPLAEAVAWTGLAWLAAGGLAYTVGAIVYVRERPNLVPGVFGHHELWHLLVLAGSACHFGFMAIYVAG